MKSSIIHGNLLSQTIIPIINNPKVKIPGIFNNIKSSVCLDDSILSKHMLLIGGTGCGKTNVFFHIVNQLKKNMSKDDVMIIFDTKGDFFNSFYNINLDVVISNAKQFDNQIDYWNIYKDILADGFENENIESNISEITWSIFDEAIKNNSSNSFFPNAARDLFSAILNCITRTGKESLDFKKEFFNNSALKKFLDSLTSEKILNMLSVDDDFASVKNYIGDGNNGQGLGVMAEMQNVVRKIFTGVFAKDGRFSIRNFVRGKGGKTLFIEYDLSKGKVLTPIYQLLFDLALKEAMGRTKSQGNVYFICDEFKLLPNLQHIEDAVNFGRSLGVKVIAGLQSITQLYENYGEHHGKNIAAGFSTVFSFKTNDATTRDFTMNLYGKNYIIEQYKSINNTLTEKERIGNIVEDWDISRLEIGEAIVGLSYALPFKFRFDLYK